MIIKISRAPYKNEMIATKSPASIWKGLLGNRTFAQRVKTFKKTKSSSA